MKKLFVLSALFIPISFLLLQSNSFSNATIKNDLKLSFVSEENALISIKYSVGKHFEVINNSANAIEIDRVELIGDTNSEIKEIGKNKSYLIQPGGNKEFNITNNPHDLPGTFIQVNAHWDGGSTEIKSTIPENFFNKQDSPETEKEKEIPKLILESEKTVILESVQPEIVTPESPVVIEEQSTPRIKETENTIIEELEEKEVKEPEIPVENTDKTKP